MNVKRQTREACQGVFEFKSRGGLRAGAGRKAKGERPLVPHRPREVLAKHFPVHVTMRLRPGLSSLRRTSVRRVLERAFAASRERFGTRLVHYSIQSNHVHMIVEAEGRQALSRAMQGFAIRVAKALNKLWGRTGKIFADRYHDRILRTPREVRNALVYVLKNHAKHGIAIAGLDPYASGSALDGWEDAPLRKEHAWPSARAKTWLLGTGWKLLGLLQLAEVPRGACRGP